MRVIILHYFPVDKTIVENKAEIEKEISICNNSHK